jgi:hypothetical protein
MEKLVRKPQTGNNKILLAAMLVAALQPTKQQIEQSSMEGAAREGSPEFETLTKRIAISNDEKNTMQSPTGLGTIVMNIAGRIRNMTGKTLTGLEIKVAVVDQLNNPVKEKTLVVVPTQRERLEPNETMPVRVMMEGFSKDDDRAMIRWVVTAIKTE